MSSCIYLLHVSLIAITLGPQPHGDEIAFANTLMTARSIPLAHPSHSATWLLPARAELESLVVWSAPASLEAAISANCSLAYRIPVPDNRFPHTFSAAYHRYMSGSGPRYTTAPSPSSQASRHRLPANPSSGRSAHACKDCSAPPPQHYHTNRPCSPPTALPFPRRATPHNG